MSGVLTTCIRPAIVMSPALESPNHQESIMATATARTRVINLRTDEARRALIDRAAEALGKDRTEFMHVICPSVG